MLSTTSTKVLAVYIPFNNLNVCGHLAESATENWIKRRLDIFMKFTLESLKHQTCQDFKAYVLYNPKTQDILNTLLKHYPPLPKNILFVTPDDYERHIATTLNPTCIFYELHLDSDDLYHCNMIHFLYTIVPKPTTQVLICQNGYIYHSPTHQLIEYFNFSSSFNCFIYYNYDQNHRYILTSYMGAIHLTHEFIPFPAYINHCHTYNVAFSFDQECARQQVYNVWFPHEHIRVLRGAQIDDPKSRQLILQNFGIKEVNNNV